jgi:hypothetical protein
MRRDEPEDARNAIDVDASYVIAASDPFISDLAMLIHQLAYPWTVPLISFLQKDEEFEMTIVPNTCHGGSAQNRGHAMGGVNCCGPADIPPTEAFMHAMYVNMLDASPFDMSYDLSYNTGSLVPLVDKIEFISRKRVYELDAVMALEGTIMFRVEYEAPEAELITKTREKLGLKPAKLVVEKSEAEGFWKRFEKEVADGRYVEVMLKGEEESEWAREPLKLYHYRGTEENPITEVVPGKVFLEIDEYSPPRLFLYPTVRPSGYRTRKTLPGEARTCF